jgi:hypothetical protein
LSKGTKTQVIFVKVVSLDKYIWLHIVCQSTLMPTLDKKQNNTQFLSCTKWHSSLWCSHFKPPASLEQDPITQTKAKKRRERNGG